MRCIIDLGRNDSIVQINMINYQDDSNTTTKAGKLEEACMPLYINHFKWQESRDRVCSDSADVLNSI